MTDDEKRITEAFGKCADVRLPDDFADRLVRRIRGEDEPRGAQDHGVIGKGLARVVLVAASLSLLLGFVPALDLRDTDSGVPVVHCDAIRPADSRHEPDDSLLDGLAMLGFCREAIRRRTKSLVEMFRRRREED